jgi:hypothetical protein
MIGEEGSRDDDKGAATLLPLPSPLLLFSEGKYVSEECCSAPPRKMAISPGAAGAIVILSCSLIALFFASNA